jgi:AcrR family transcriptional regulator
VLVGLRETKKERTREELAAAALGLFIERGYDATTIEDIAAVADVSARTFFRYFPSKDDVVLDVLRAAALDLATGLDARPVDEPLPAALRSAARAWAESRQPPALLQASRLLRSCPSLRARAEQQRQCSVDGLTEAVARRLTGAAGGSAPMIVAMVVAVLSSTIDQWAAAGGSGDLAGALDAGFDLLEFGIPTGRPAA